MNYRKTLFLLIGFLTLAHAESKAQQLRSLHSYNAGGNENDIRVEHDTKGNIITAGWKVIPSGPGGGGNPMNMWITKFDSTGSKIWELSTTKTSSGSEIQFVDMAVDNSDNIYVTGLFTGDYFSLGSDTIHKQKNIWYDLFYGMIGPSGSVEWLRGADTAKSYPAKRFTNSISIATDGNILITGSFYRDLAIGGKLLTGNHNVPTSSNPYIPSGFYAKLDQEGNAVWIKEVALLNSQQGNGRCGIADLQSGSTKSYYMTVGIDSAIVFGNDTLVSAGSDPLEDLTAILKLDHKGDVVGKRIIRSPYNTLEDFEVDNCGNPLLLGTYLDSLAIGTGKIHADSGREVFVAKLDHSLNAEWVRNFGSDEGERANGIHHNDQNEVFFTFDFWGTIDYQGNPHTPSPFGKTDLVLFKLSPDGTILWHRHSHGSGSSRATDLSVSMDGDIASVSSFFGTEAIGNKSATVWGGSGSDVLLATFRDTIPSINTDPCGTPSVLYGKTNKKADFRIFPNPAIEQIHISSARKGGNKWKVDVIDAQGRTIHKKRISDNGTIDVSYLENGIYFLLLRSENEVKRIKFIKE